MLKTILFQGDSVTDVERLTDSSSNGYGNGYVRMIAEHFDKDESMKVINKGISGNRTIDLINRWEEDCIAQNPDVITILIGINDVWRQFDSGMVTTTLEFEANYELLIKRCKEESKARIILMEPFVLPYPADRMTWRSVLDPQIQVVRALAQKYNTGLVNLDGIFAKAAITYGYQALCEDGVHPTKLGHKLIMDSWLEEYNRI